MALLRPRFQIDGELATGTTGFNVPNSGGITNLVSITGAGLIKQLSYSFDSIKSAGNDVKFDLVLLEIIVDGVTIFSKNLEDTEIITESGTGANLDDFHLNITVADDLFDLEMKDMAFLTSFIVRFVNNDGVDNMSGQMEGATLWHKGA